MMLRNESQTRNYINNRVNAVQSYQVPALFAQFGVEYLNILVFGPKKSGKSSVPRPQKRMDRLGSAMATGPTAGGWRRGRREQKQE